jgi:hypothetical protein
MMDPQYMSRACPGGFPSSGWVSGAYEAEALCEPPWNFTETFNYDSHWVQPIS